MKLIPMRGLVRVWFSHMESIWRDNERWWFAKYVCHIIDTPSWCHHVTPTLNLDTKPPHEKTECNWVSSQKKWQYIKNWIQVCHSAVSVPLFVTLHCIALHCIILLSHHNSGERVSVQSLLVTLHCIIVLSYLWRKYKRCQCSLYLWQLTRETCSGWQRNMGTNQSPVLLPVSSSSTSL